MCSICGIFSPKGVGSEAGAICVEMSKTMTCRGPDASGDYLGEIVALSHNRLAVMDPERGAQPMTVCFGRKRYTIVYNGEIYNLPELSRELAEKGVTLSTRCDTEALVYAYAVFRENCLAHISGIFAFAVWDHENESLFLARDPLGVKPLYFAEKNGTFLFASEPKALLKHPLVTPKITLRGLWQLLYLAPITLPGTSIYRDILSLLPGECMTVDQRGIRRRRYFTLTASPTRQTREEATIQVRELLVDAVKRQSIADVPLASFLSGGLDSSAVSAILAETMRERGEVLSTYSFEYVGNDYAPTLFQPNRDDDFARLAAREIGSSHRVLTLSSEEVASALAEAAVVRDFPGQADIDSSLLAYCRLVKENHTVALSGECADEIFGGYPWFYRPEMLERPFFPWLHDPFARASLFDPAFASPDVGYRSLSAHYKDFVASVERGGEDDDEMYRSRIATQLSVWYFMQSLLERKDRMSMYNAVEVRVPFADHRILEYVYNVPWKYKFENGVEKSLLRSAMEGVLPDRILHRKKSPYPKTHDPAYELLTKTALLAIVNDPGSRLYHLLNRKKLLSFMNGEDTTWFGQLMARPQLYAWLLQMEYWLETYRVSFV